MLVKQFKPTDVAFLHKCEQRHGLPTLTDPATIPLNTILVSGVAVASIRAVEGNFWLMDGLITNPLCSSSTRDSALKSLYAYITKTYSPIMAWSMDAGAMYRAKQYGFEQLPQYTILRYSQPQ